MSHRMLGVGDGDPRSGRRQRVEPDDSLHEAGDAGIDRRLGGVGKSGLAVGQGEAVQRRGEGALDRPGARGHRQRQAVGRDRAGGEAVLAQRGAHGGDLGGGRCEALGELADAQIVVIQARAGSRDGLGVGGEAGGVTRLERHRGVHGGVAGHCAELSRAGRDPRLTVGGGVKEGGLRRARSEGDRGRREGGLDETGAPHDALGGPSWAALGSVAQALGHAAVSTGTYDARSPKLDALDGCTALRVGDAGRGP